MEKGNANLHFFDRFLGIPIIAFLSLFKFSRRTIPKDFRPKRIALLNISSIGDTVLMSAIIQDLKIAYHDAEIEVFCGATNQAVFGMIPIISSVKKLPVTNVFESIKEIRNSGSFDLLIDFGPWPRLNAIFSFWFKAKYSVGFNSIGQYRHFGYDMPVAHSDQKHELDNFRHLLSPLSINSSSNPTLQLPAKANPIEGDRYILFHPWPGGFKSYMKEWPKENWLSLAKRLANSGYKLYVTGAKADVEATEELVAQCSGLLTSLAGKYNLEQTALIVKDAALLVTVNTGIMHIGAALGVKMVALHGPTSVLRWGPATDNAVNICPENSQCGYLHFGYEYDRSTINCMELISVEQVYTAVLKQLS